MKTHNFLLMAMSVIAMSACALHEAEEFSSNTKGEKMVFTAELVNEEATKTQYQPDNSIWWTPGDAICIFYGNSEGNYFVSGLSEPAPISTFSGTLNAFTGVTESGDFNYFWAIYPYTSAISCDGTMLTATLPHNQEAKAGTFAPNTNVTMAKSLGLALSFYNIGAWLRFSVVKEGVTSVTLRGNNGEFLAGTFQATMIDSGAGPRPSILDVTSGVDYITISLPDGAPFEPNVFYFLTLFPQTLSGGLNMVFETETEIATRTVNSSVNFPRSVFQKATQFDKNVVYVPKDAPDAVRVVVSQGGGTITLPNTTDPVVLDFSSVTDGSDYTIEYNAGGLIPDTIYCIGKSTTNVGTLSGDLASSTVKILSGTYAGTSLTTALNTLVISVGVKVGNVTINGGSVTVDGEVTSLSVKEDASSSDDDKDKIIVVINNTVVNVDCQETNCTLHVAESGAVTVMATQAESTTVSGTVQDVTAGENAGSVTVSQSGSVSGTLDTQAGATTIEGAVENLSAGQGAGSVTVSEGGSVTGTLDTQAENTTIQGSVENLSAGDGAKNVTVSEGGSVTGTLDTKAENTTIESGGSVGTVEASGAGEVNVEGNATVDSVSASGDVEVNISAQAKTSEGTPVPMLYVKVGDGVFPLTQEAHNNIKVTVNTNMAWTCAIPAGSSWISTDTGINYISGDAGESSFYINVEANTSPLGRKASLKFEYGSAKSETIISQYGTDGGFGGSIDDWGDGGEGTFHKD